MSDKSSGKSTPAGQGATPPPARTKWSDLRRRVYLPGDDLSGPPRYTDEYVRRQIPFGAIVSGIIEIGPAMQDIDILDMPEWALAEVNPDGVGPHT